MPDKLVRTVLLTAASGNIGRVLVPLLLSSKDDGALKLVLPTTKATHLKTITPILADESRASRVALEEGSLRDPVWFESILKKHAVDAVFLCATGTDEMFTVLNCLSAIADAGCVKKLIYLSILGNFASAEGLEEIYRDRGYAHIFAKVVVEQKLLHGRYPFDWTVIGPPFFFSNDLRQKAALTQMGVYHEPDMAKGGSRISLEDISLAIFNVLVDEDGTWNRMKINMGSKHSWTSTEVAEVWSKALGKPIRTQSATKEVLDEFEQGARASMGPGLDGFAWARDLRLMFEYMTTHGVGISKADYEVQLQLLGKEPDDFAEWAVKTAASWKSP